MKSAIFLALVSITFAASGRGQDGTILPAPAPRVATAQPVAPQVANPTTSPQYVIKCQLFRQNAQGKTVELSAPTLMVTEGQQGQIAIQGQLPFVTGIKASQAGGDATPVVTQITEGTVGSVTIASLNEDRVQVDAEFSVSNIVKVDTIESNDSTTPVTQAPRVLTKGWRVVQSLTLGNTIDILDAEDHTVAKLTVDRLSADEAAITPIGAAEPATDAVDLNPAMVTRVYAVSELLEDYAKHLDDDQLQPSDFVLVLDRIRELEGVEWPRGTRVTSVPARRAVSITHTAAGHAQISTLLEEERTFVADAKKLLLK